MCSYATISPHFAQTRWYLMRPWSSSWSWLNDRPFSSVAGNTLIGMETSPKEIAPFHMVLGMVSTFRVGVEIVAAGVAATRNFPSSIGPMPRRNSGGPAFTVEIPEALTAAPEGEVLRAPIAGSAH